MDEVYESENGFCRWHMNHGGDDQWAKEALIGSPDVERRSQTHLSVVSPLAPWWDSNITFIYSTGSGDFDSRKRLSGVRISRGSTNITFLYLAGSGDFASGEGLSGVEIFGERTDIVFLPFGRVRSSTLEKVSLEWESLEGGTNTSFFHLVGSRYFDFRDSLSGVRISRGNTDVALLHSVGSGDFDSRD